MLLLLGMYTTRILRGAALGALVSFTSFAGAQSLPREESSEPAQRLPPGIPMSSDPRVNSGTLDQSFATIMTRSLIKLAEASLEVAARGGSLRIRDLAAMISKDSKLSLGDLGPIAEQAALELPTNLDKEQEKALEALVRLDGAELDRAYLLFISEETQQLLATLRKVGPTLSDARLRGWATSLIPLVTLHQHEARETTAVLANQE